MNDEIKNNPQQESNAIDFTALFSSLWKYRKLYYIVLGITFVLALLVGAGVVNHTYQQLINFFGPFFWYETW